MPSAWRVPCSTLLTLHQLRRRGGCRPGVGRGRPGHHDRAGIWAELGAGNVHAGLGAGRAGAGARRGWPRCARAWPRSRPRGRGGSGGVSRPAGRGVWAGSARPRRGCACWPRRWRMVDHTGIAGTKPRCIGSRASCCCSRPSRTRPRRKPASSRPSPWPAASRPSRGSCGRRMSLSSPVAAAGQARRSAGVARTDLRLVHRGV